MRFSPFGGRAALAVIVIAAFALGFTVRGCGSTEHVHPEAAPADTGHDATRAEVWTCSMHPQIRLPKPGKCPICGMTLIRVSSSTAAPDEGLRTYTTSKSATALMQLETSPVERRFVTAEVRMAGTVDYDETKLAYISAWVPGRLDRLYVDYTGLTVKKGDHLVYMYSPEVLTAQAELRRAANAVQTMRGDVPEALKKTAQSTYEAAQEKLRRWGLTADQIREAEKQGAPSDHITIYAPIGGTVIERNGREGMYVQTGTPIYTIADLSSVWVKLDAYESDLPWIHYGQKVEFTTEALPGEVFEGKIAFIEPTLNEMTRTTSVRVNVPNPDGRLKPEMFVRGIVRARIATAGRIMDPALAGKWICPMHPEVIKNAAGVCDLCGMNLVQAEKLGYVSAGATDADKPLVIPASAPLITGKRAVVYVQLPGTAEPTFEGREIVLGARAGDFYIVRNGLREGERVVTKGNFNIDSALQILAKPSMMTPDAGLDATSIPQDATTDKTLVTLADVFRSVQSTLGSTDATQRSTALTALEGAVKTADSVQREGVARQYWDEYSMRLNNGLVVLRDAATQTDRDTAIHNLSNTMGHITTQFGLTKAMTSHSTAPASFRAQLAPLIDSYTALHSALANDNAAAGTAAAQQALETLKTIAPDSLDAAMTAQWTAFLSASNPSLRAIADAKSIEAQRAAFGELSAQSIRALDALGVPDGATLYQIHCPMAFDGTGADWLQRDKEVKNPYFGQAMPTCGTVTAEIGAHGANAS